MAIPLRLAADVPGRERLLRERLLGDPAAREAVLVAVEAAFVDGLLALLRLGPGARAAHRAAAGAVPADAALSGSTFARWHRELGGSGETRRTALEGAAPPEFVAERLESLRDWLDTDSGRELVPAAAGALVLARVLEIQPFEQNTPSVALLAARHVMRRGGGLGPVLGEEDREALRSAVPAACTFETRPLAEVLERGAARALELAVAELERR